MQNERGNEQAKDRAKNILGNKWFILPLGFTALLAGEELVRRKINKAKQVNKDDIETKNSDE